MRIFFKIVLIVFVLIIALSGVAIYWTFYKPVPNYNQELSFSGLDSEVSIFRDDYAIPHIHAETRKDAFFAAGFVHAQDRLWQMTLMQLMAEGRFAEHFGEDLVDLDKMLRVLGFHRTALLNYELLSDEEKELLTAYSNGVNAWILDNPKSLPMEFTLSGVDPIPWTPLHSLSIFRLMAWELNQSWWAKAALHQLEQELSTDDFQKFLPRYFPETGNPRTYSDTTPIQDFLNADFAMRDVLNFEGYGAGSNAWAVDGNKSRNGYPMLAGDPHLGLSMPSRWYEIHFVVGDQNVSGATIPGLPVAFIGQNDFAAWSLTNVMLDDTDFFQIAEDPNDRGRYIIDSTATEVVFSEYKISREIIHVKDADDILHPVRFTKFGPVINDIHSNEDAFSTGRYAARWTGFDASNEFSPLMTLNWSNNFQEIQADLHKVSVPAQHIIYADVTGNIAHFVTGKIPIRSNPLRLRRSWIPADQWNGFVDFDDLPHEINPDRGWVGNANQNFMPDNSPTYISAFWHPDARMNRIQTFLNEKDEFTVDDFKIMQNDTYSVFAENLVNIILPVITKNPEDSLLAEAIPYLSNWDFQYDINEVGASITDVFITKFAAHLFGDKLSESAYKNYTKSSYRTFNQVYHALRADNDPLLPANQRDSLITISVQETITFLSDSLSNRSFQWRWENLHKLHLKAPVFSEGAKSGGVAKMIHNNILARGPFSYPGSITTLNMGGYSFSEPYSMTLGPSIRRIVDLSDMSRSFSIVPGGQSGNPLSPYYDDQLDDWIQGKYKTFIHDGRFQNNYKSFSTILNPL